MKEPRDSALLKCLYAQGSGLSVPYCSKIAVRMVVGRLERRVCVRMHVRGYW